MAGDLGRVSDEAATGAADVSPLCPGADPAHQRTDQSEWPRPSTGCCSSGLRGHEAWLVTNLPVARVRLLQMPTSAPT